MTSGVSTQTWIIQVCSKCTLPYPAKCLMCLKILTDPCRTSPLSIKLIVSDKLLGARNLWSVKLQLDIPNPAQSMRPCASVLCLGPGSRSYKCKVSPTRLCMPCCSHPSGNPGPQRFSSLQGHLSKGVSGWDLISLSEFVLKTQAMAFCLQLGGIQGSQSELEIYWQVASKSGPYLFDATGTPLSQMLCTSRSQL